MDILVQHSDKFMHSIVFYCTVILSCIVLLIYCYVDIIQIQCYA